MSSRGSVTFAWFLAHQTTGSSTKQIKPAEELKAEHTKSIYEVFFLLPFRQKKGNSWS
jgi:hypothetical protein